MRKLQVILSKVQKLETVLANTRDLHDQGELKEDVFQFQIAKYKSLLKQAREDLTAIRESLKRSRERQHGIIQTLRQESDVLEARFKIGEISVNDYRKQDKRLRSKTARAEQRLREINQLMSAESPAQVGGFVDVPLERRLPENALTWLTDMIPSALAWPDFTSVRFVEPRNWTFTLTKVVATCGTGLMLLSILLPWVCVGGFFSTSATCFRLGFWGAVCLLMVGFHCALLFVEGIESKPMVQIAIGGIALVAFALALRAATRGYGGIGWSLAAGGWFYLLGLFTSIAIAIAELVMLRQRDQGGPGMAG